VLPPGVAAIEMDSVQPACETRPQMFTKQRLLRAHMNAVLVHATAKSKITQRLE
jgi:hypothetical protein